MYGPLIGQRVKLRSGVIADVVSIARGVDAFRSKTEMEILVLAPTMQSVMGADWMNRYYEAIVNIGYESRVVTPRDVVEILDPE